MKRSNHDQAKFLKLLSLMNLLLPTGHTIKEMASRLEVSTKTIQRYLKTFEMAGLDIDYDERKRHFLILPSQNTQSKTVKLDRNEIELINEALNKTFSNNPTLPGLIAKLDPTEGIIRNSITANKKIRHSNYISDLNFHIKTNSLCRLKYQTTSDENQVDKVIYPIRFSNHFEYLIGYDLEKQKYINLRLERIYEVNPYDGKEKPPKKIGPSIEIDHFHMANNQESFQVKIGLTLLSSRILQEEFPVTDDSLTKQDDILRPYLYKTTVYSLLPVARFCMGFPTEVTVYEPRELIEMMQVKMNQIKMGH
jgi:predicted DNA-binding transcriptional regulator YafY